MPARSSCPTIAPAVRYTYPCLRVCCVYVRACGWMVACGGCLVRFAFRVWVVESPAARRWIAEGKKQKRNEGAAATIQPAEGDAHGWTTHRSTSTPAHHRTPAHQRTASSSLRHPPPPSPLIGSLCAVGSSSLCKPAAVHRRRTSSHTPRHALPSLRRPLAIRRRHLRRAQAVIDAAPIRPPPSATASVLRSE